MYFRINSLVLSSPSSRVTEPSSTKRKSLNENTTESDVFFSDKEAEEARKGFKATVEDKDALSLGELLLRVEI